MQHKLCGPMSDDTCTDAWSHAQAVHGWGWSGCWTIGGRSAHSGAGRFALEQGIVTGTGLLSGLALIIGEVSWSSGYSLAQQHQQDTSHRVWPKNLAVEQLGCKEHEENDTKSMLQMLLQYVESCVLTISSSAAISSRALCIAHATWAYASVLCSTNFR